MIAFEQMLKKAENARISVKTMIEPVAEALGNTVAISRKSYVHPALIEAVKEDRATRSAGWSGRARANGCRPARSGCQFLAKGEEREHAKPRA